MKYPDRAEWQITDVKPVRKIAGVEQNDIAQTVRLEVLGFEGLQKHGNISADEEE